jgi:hypothetical protein
MPKYLMIDNGGVLDGVITYEICDEDLLLQEIDDGLFQALKDGIQIINQLNELVNNYDYEIVFHSKNQADGQLDLLNILRIACDKKGLIFPKLKAMAARDPKKYAGVTSNEPYIEIVKETANENKILVAGYDLELDGKACVRQALSKLLNIAVTDRAKHVVLDDGPSVIDKAKEEGWIAYQVDEMHSLSKIINNIYQEVITTKANHVMRLKI